MKRGSYRSYTRVFTVFAMRIEMDRNIHECKNSKQSLQERLPGYSLLTN